MVGALKVERRILVHSNFLRALYLCFRIDGIWQVTYNFEIQIQIRCFFLSNGTSCGASRGADRQLRIRSFDSVSAPTCRCALRVDAIYRSMV